MKKITLFLFLILVLFTCSCKGKQVTLTIDYGTHLEQKTITQSKNEAFLEPSNVVIEHGTIKEYIYEDGKSVKFPLKIKNNTTIYADIEMEKYTYKFLDYNNAVIKEVYADYGSIIEYPDDPVREGNESFNYTFSSWDKSETILTHDIVFKARYKSTYKTYNVKLIDYFGNETVLEDVFAGDSLEKPEDPEIVVNENQYYKVLGWQDTKSGEFFNFIEDSVYSDLELKCIVDIADIYKQPLEGARVSIIGDSISTFYEKGSEANSLYHGKNQYHYPIYSQTVKDVKQTWWYQTILNVNAKLGINNSWAGTDNASPSANAGRNPSRLKTLDDFGHPDIIFIYMGTNDNGNGNSVKAFKESLIYQVDYINENFIIKMEDGMYHIPEIYIFTLGYSNLIYNSTEERRLAYNEQVKYVASLYENVNVFDLASFVTKDNYQSLLGDRVHYNDVGMKLIADNLTKQLRHDYGVNEEAATSIPKNVAYFDRKDNWRNKKC